MIKFTLKTYFLSLRWIFIPLLIMAICLVPACAIFLIQTKNQINSMTDSLSQEFSTISCDIEGLINYVLEAAKSLPWKTPFVAINKIVKEDWLSTVIAEFMEKTNESVYTSAMQGNIKNTANSIVNNLAVFPIAIIGGMLIAYLFTASFLRKKTCPRSIWKTILNVVIDLLITTFFLTGIIALLGVWVHSVFITSVLTALLYGFISISEAYLIHRDKKMKYVDVVNPKSVASLVCSYLLLLLLAVGIIVLLFLIPIKMVSLLLSLPVIIITFIDYNLAAESYVVSKRSDYTRKIKNA